MRTETKALQSKVAELQASDERVATTLAALQSWSERLERSIESERLNLKKSVDNYCDGMQGELKVLRGELKSVVDKLLGASVEEPKGEGEKKEEAEGGGETQHPGVTPLKRKA